MAMTKNELKLIELIRGNDNPVQAMTTAALIILGHLKQHGSSQAQAPVARQGLA